MELARLAVDRLLETLKSPETLERWQVGIHHDLSRKPGVGSWDECGILLAVAGFGRTHCPNRSINV